LQEPVPDQAARSVSTLYGSATNSVVLFSKCGRNVDDNMQCHLTSTRNPL